MTNTRQKVLDQFIKNPDKIYSISELSLKLNINIDGYLRNLLSTLLKENLLKSSNRGYYQLEKTNPKNLKEISLGNIDPQVVKLLEEYRKAGNPRVHGLKIEHFVNLDYDTLGKEWKESSSKELKTLYIRKEGFGRTTIHITPKGKDDKDTLIEKPKMQINYRDTADGSPNRITLDHAKLMEWKGIVETYLELQSNIQISLDPFKITQIGIGKDIKIGQFPELTVLNNLNVNMKFQTLSGLMGEIYVLNPESDEKDKELRMSGHTNDGTFQDLYSTFITTADFTRLNDAVDKIEKNIDDLTQTWKVERKYDAEKMQEFQDAEKSMIKYIDSNNQIQIQLEKNQIKVQDDLKKQNEKYTEFGDRIETKIKSNQTQIDDKFDKLIKVVKAFVNESRSYQEQNEQQKLDTNFVNQDLFDRSIANETNQNKILKILTDNQVIQDSKIDILNNKIDKLIDIKDKQDETIDKLTLIIQNITKPKENKIKIFFKRIFP